MKLTTLAGPRELAERAAEEIVETVRVRPDAIIVLPTGNTPLPTYARVLEVTRRSDLDWSRVRIVALDEYAGIARDDPRVLGAWLQREIVGPLGIGAGNYIRFDPSADPEAECARVDGWLGRHGPADLAVLGLGLNGHLGFNEPGTPFEYGTHHVRLTPESVASNAVYWSGEESVPRSAFTLGLATLLSARRLMLLVSGPAKADIFARSMEGAIGPDIPATSLRTHADCLVLADRAAASALLHASSQ